jgi:hypothetical protein
MNVTLYYNLKAWTLVVFCTTKMLVLNCSSWWLYRRKLTLSLYRSLGRVHGWSRRLEKETTLAISGIEMWYLHRPASSLDVVLSYNINDFQEIIVIYIPPSNTITSLYSKIHVTCFDRFLPPSGFNVQNLTVFKNIFNACLLVF